MVSPCCGRRRARDGAFSNNISCVSLISQFESTPLMSIYLIARLLGEESGSFRLLIQLAYFSGTNSVSGGSADSQGARLSPDIREAIISTPPPASPGSPHPDS